MKYSDRYKTMTVRLTPKEWAEFLKSHQEWCDAKSVEISKHRFIKWMMREWISAA